jgi:hypothetical protein
MNEDNLVRMIHAVAQQGSPFEEFILGHYHNSNVLIAASECGSRFSEDELEVRSYHRKLISRHQAYDIGMSIETVHLEASYQGNQVFSGRYALDIPDQTRNLPPGPGDFVVRKSTHGPWRIKLLKAASKNSVGKLGVDIEKRLSTTDLVCRE